MRREPPSIRHRVGTLATVTVLHAALLALFLTQRRDVPPPIAASSSISVIAVNAEQPAATKPPPLPAKLADTFKPVVEFSIPTESESDAPAGASGACAPEKAVLDALLIDAEAREAIRGAPPEVRTNADAIVIWNEAWNPVVAAISAPLYRVRGVVEGTLVRLAPACLDEPVTGPRLLPIPDATGERTSFIVVGSGVWTWRGLLDQPPPAGTVQAGPAAGAPPPATQ
jgi:hypothetical protein